jgi:hypothetical protein
LRVFHAAADALAPGELTEEERRFRERFVRRMARLMDPLVLWTFRVGLVVLDLWTWVVHPRHRRFVRLPLAERLGVLQAWSASRIPLRRELMKGLIALSMLPYYSSPRVQAALGYYPQEQLRAALRAREVRDERAVG